MLTQPIKDKLIKLFDETPENVGVSFGYKKTKKQNTGEKSIVFLVEKKKPIEELHPNEVLPSNVEIDGVNFKTDVVEIGKIKALCDQTTIGQCYNWSPAGNTIPPNRGTIRPLKGGVSVTSKNNDGGAGTLGFIAVDIDTQALVGVTNNHVVISDAFYTSERNINDILENEFSDNAYQPAEPPPVSESWKIGEVVRYVPIYSPDSPFAYYNSVDGALISLTSTTISNTESFKQLGLTGQLPMPFATTAEIDTLLIQNPPLYSTGRTTGAKEGSPCGLVVSSIGVIIPVNGYIMQGNQTFVYFNDLIEFTRIDPTCPYPIFEGDSGSALIANYNGVWKIIGLCFAGGYETGYACRIDNVAAELNIEAWDGTAKNFINPATKDKLTVPLINNVKILSCNGKTYWQAGLTNISDPKCNIIIDP